MSDVEDEEIRVLHVDDDPEIVDLAATFLEREDERLTVEPAATAEEALEKIRSEAVDCLISDYQLPDMKCATFVESVRQVAPDLPFILFTGRDRTHLDEETVVAELTAYLQKGSGTQQYGELAAEIVEAVNREPQYETDGGRRPASERRAETPGGPPLDDGPSLAGIEGVDGGTVATGLLDAVGDAVLLVDADDALVYWNGATTRLTGMDEAELASAAPAELFVAEDRDRIEEMVRTGREHGTQPLRTAVAAVDGERTPVEVHAEPLRDPAGDVVAVALCLRDVSTALAYERELARYAERLEEVVGTVSHDFRNPLNVITGRLELAKETGDEDHFEAVKRSTYTVETLIDDLVELARQGNPVSHTETMDLGETSEDTWGRAATASATLSVDTDRSVEGDPERVRQLLTELFENAAVHGGDGVTVTVGDLADGFYVADDGPGIPAEERESVIEYGETADRERSGLGLALASRIAEAHGWSLRIVESETGGARIEIGGLDGPTPPAP